MCTSASSFQHPRQLSQTRQVPDHADCKRSSFYFMLGTTVKTFDPSSGPDNPIGNPDKEIFIMAH
jgi:hypothetical protein